MRLLTGIVLLSLLTGASAAAAPPALSDADKAAAFKAAGFTLKGGQWVRCEDDVTESKQTGSLEVADLNGDGAPEAWIRESSTFCYGNTAEAFVLLTRRPAGWAVILDEVGMAAELGAKTHGWPDIEVGGPGFDAMPVFRFNGDRYVRR